MTELDSGGYNRRRTLTYTRDANGRGRTIGLTLQGWQFVVAVLGFLLTLGASVWGAVSVTLDAKIEAVVNRRVTAAVAPISAELSVQRAEAASRYIEFAQVAASSKSHQEAAGAQFQQILGGMQRIETRVDRILELQRGGR